MSKGARKRGQENWFESGGPRDRDHVWKKSPRKRGGVLQKKKMWPGKRGPQAPTGEKLGGESTVSPPRKTWKMLLSEKTFLNRKRRARSSTTSGKF